MAVPFVFLTAFVCHDVLGVLAGQPAQVLFLAAGAMAVYNAAFSSMPARLLARRGVALAQVVLDLGTLTIMLAFTGGVDNPFFVFYLFHVVIAGILLGRFEAYTVTLVACALFGGLLVVQGPGADPAFDSPFGHPPERGGHRTVHAAGTLVAFVAAAGATAYFATSIVATLRRRGVELAVANQALAVERAKTEDIVQSVGAGLLVLDDRNRIQWSNRIARDWFGSIRPGESCLGSLWNSSSTCAGCPLERVAEGIVGPACERAITIDGRRRFFLISASPLRSAEGADGSRLALIQDVTTLKEMEIQLLQAGRLAAVGEFAAGVAHEINNPLAVVSSSAEILAALEPPVEPFGRHLRKISDGAFRCKEIVQNLLDVSRQDRDEPETADLSSLVDETLRLLEGTGRARERRIRFERPAAGDRPAVLVSTRPNRIQQVLLNLVLHALDATGPGGPVTVSTRATGSGVELSVADDGTGIATEILPRIFEPFFTTKPPGKGTGLGLYVSHQIVQGLGGRLRVESHPGQGATFVVDLPRQAPS